MAICEKYKREMTPEKAVCPDPHIYCGFRTVCLIYAAYEEALEDEEIYKEV